MSLCKLANYRKIFYYILIIFACLDKIRITLNCCFTYSNEYNSSSSFNFQKFCLEKLNTWHINKSMIATLIAGKQFSSNYFLELLAHVFYPEFDDSTPKVCCFDVLSFYYHF